MMPMPYRWALTACCVLLVCAAAFAQEDVPDPNAPSALQRTLPKQSAPPIEPTPMPEDTKNTAPTQMDIQRAELRAAISQLMIVTLEGTSLFTSQDRFILKNYTPGGAIIRAVGRPSFAADYITELRSYADKPAEGQFLLIGADMFSLPRRDLVQKDRFFQLPSLLALAAADDPVNTKRFGEFVSMTLETMGFNFHLGPSLALAPEISAAEGTVQCLGGDPFFAGEAAHNIFAAFEEKNLAAMPMHFPGGYYNRGQDAPPILITKRERLASQDLLPYKRAIEAGVRMIHVGNIMVPTIDDDPLPASLSPVVIGEVLRQDLAFDGVVVAGPIDSPDVVREADKTDAAILSLIAGADMLLWNESGTTVQRAVDGIVEAVATGVIDSETIDDRIARITDLKLHYKLHEREMPDKGDAKKLEKKKRYTEEAYEIERRSITLLSNRNRALPITEKSMPLMITGVADTAGFLDAFDDRFKKAPIYVQPIVSAKHANRIHDFEIDRITKRAKSLGTVLCVFDTGHKLPGQVEIVQKLKAKGVRVVVVLLGYPDTVGNFRDADAIVLAYADSAYIKQSIPAIVDVLTGVAPVRILAPVRDLETRVGKTEVYNAYHVVQTPAGRFPINLEPPFVAGRAVPYDIDDTIKRVEWEFGDGEREKGFIVEHAFEAVGRYPITLTVTDENGEETTRSFHASVSP